MPSFPWSKKGSHASTGAGADPDDRSASRAGHASSSSPSYYQQQQQPPTPSAVHPRLYPTEPYLPDQDLSRSGASLQPLRQPQPDLHTGRPLSPPQPVAGIPHNTNIDTRQGEPRKLFKKRFGLSSSRDDLLDGSEDSGPPPETSRIRRTLSTSRTKPDSRGPQRTFTSAAAPGGRIAPITRRSTTLAEREVEASSADTEGLRDLADFLKFTAPPSDPRRPISVVGSPSQWAEQSSPPDSANAPDPRASASRFNRRSSFDQPPLRPQAEHQRFAPPADSHLSYEQPHTQQIERGYEPYPLHVQLEQQGTLPTIPQDHSVSHQSALRDPANEALYQQQDLRNPYGQVEHTRAHLGLHSGAASELDAHLGVQSVHAPARAFDESSNDSPRSPVLADMPSNVPASLQPPPRRGSAESSEPPTPGMHSKMTHPPPPQQRPQNGGQDLTPGRRSPEPGKAVGEMSEQDVVQLVREYKELRDKYSKVKRYYFEKEDQVKTLQNALAHQKLSQSRTSLDDGEYMARLTRLDGLISQLAFGFRKDWKSIPAWLHPYVNKDAIATGKQEMTAVGRAFISRWLADEVFDRYFHPGLEIDVSRELKSIQRNIRIFTPALQTAEEEEALTDKIITWRLATIDGLQHLTNAPEATQKKQTLVESLSAQLVGNLLEHMVEPPPAGIEGGVHMIIELAVAVLAHLPFESRDVVIDCFTPGMPISTDLMRVEQGVPALVAPIAELPPPEDRGSVRSHSSEMQREDTIMQDDPSSVASLSSGKDDVGNKKSLFGLMAGKKGSAPSGKASSPGSGGGLGGGGGGLTSGAGNASAGTSQNSLLQPPGSSGGPKEERVRLCVFLGLQIRGKTVLQKAPVYKM